MALRASFAQLPAGGRCTRTVMPHRVRRRVRIASIAGSPPNPRSAWAVRPAQGPHTLPHPQSREDAHHHRKHEEDVMEQPDWAAPLGNAYESALAFLTGLPTRPVGARTSDLDLQSGLGGPLPETPEDPRKVIEMLAAAAEPGLVATPSGRFFGFVVGGSSPAALAADWLTSAWDQNAGLYALG